MKTWYIGADVDSKMSHLTVECGKTKHRHRVPTTIPQLKELLGDIGGRKVMTFEEGPLADWLYRNLKDSVEELIICDPRRNRLISEDGSKSDVIDADKLAELLRLGNLRAVYHSDSLDRVLLKQWVSLYHDRVRDAVRQVNKIRARCLMHGLRPPRGALRNEDTRVDWLRSLKTHPVGGQLSMLFISLDAARLQVQQCRRQMARLSRNYPVIKAWQDVPGVGPIRATTMLAFLDTSRRFASCKKLWKYCGVGLISHSSGTDKKGRPKKGVLRMAWAVNRRLKDVVMGAAISAIQWGKNVFGDYYQRLIRNGMPPGNARHAVARKMLTVLWGMWKTSSRFDKARVCGK